METRVWPTSELITEVTQKPHQFDLFQAIRLLQQSGSNLHFRNDTSLRNRVGSISKISTVDGDLALFVSCLGLSGSYGVLPEHFTELLNERLEQKDTTLADFFDIFNHRLIALLYQIWQLSQIDTPDAFAIQLLRALSGSPSTLIPHSITRIDKQIYYSGLLSQKARSSEGLRAILQDYFSVPISISSYAGEWVDVSPTQCTRLSKLHAFNQLGVSALVGKRVWHIENRFTVQIGPLPYAQFLQLLPNGDCLEVMAAFIEFYVGIEFGFDCILLLPSYETPPCQLRQSIPLQLGWNTWLKASFRDELVTVSPQQSPLLRSRIR